MDADELDDEPDARIDERRRLMEILLGRYGWDTLKGTRSDHGAFDCDLDIRSFYEAAEQLKTDLESGRHFADTDADIVGLTTVFDSPWWRFVDPRMSRARTSPTSRAVVVMWECGVHMVALSDKGDGTWQARRGIESVVDLLDQLEQDAVLAAEEYEPDLVDKTKMDEWLDPADRERRRLLPEESQALLEDPDQP